MLSLSVNGYSADVVRNQLHAKSGGREISYRYDLLDMHGGRKGSLAVVEGEIVATAASKIQRTGRFTMREADNIDWQNDRIQPWFRLRMPDGGLAEWPLGVFYMPTAPRVLRGGHYYREVEAYDLTLSLEQDAVTERYYIARGTPYLSAIASLVASAGIKRYLAFDFSDDVLQADREWELGTSKWQIISDLAAAINYTFSVNNEGMFVSRRYEPPDRRGPDYVYAADELSVVYGGGVAQLDTFGIPNIFVGVVSSADMGEIRYTYEIDNPANPVSAYNRGGRRVVKVLRLNDIASPIAMQDAVRRAAYEAMQVYETTTFETLAMPHHETHDMLSLEHSAASGLYEEISWRLTLSPAATMQHEARKVIYL